MSLKRGRKFKKLFTALVVGGSFLFLLSAEKTLALHSTSTYFKDPQSNNTLTSGEWNSLLYNTTTLEIFGDFVNTWLPARMEGPLGIATSAPLTDRLSVVGSIRGTSLLGSLAASNVSNGAFGSNYGGGNYSFPSNLGIGTTTAPEALTVVGNIIPAVSSGGRLGTATNYWTTSYIAGLSMGSGQISAISAINGSTDLFLKPLSSSYAIKFGVSSTEYARMDGSGNIGIGITNPIALLSVKGTSTRPVLDILSSSSASILYANSTGNIGIGTTTPGTKLEIASGNVKVNGGDLYFAATAGQTATQLSSYSNADSLWLIQPTSETLILADSVSWDRSMAIKYTAGTTGNGAGRLTIGQITKNGANFTHGITSLYTNGLERFTINSSGNIGIGSTSPSSKLTLSGGDFEMDHSKSIKISSSTANTTLVLGNYADSGTFSYGTSTSKTASLALEGDLKADRLCIEEDCKAAWSEIVSAGGGGTWVLNGSNLYASSTSWNVGIGTTTPGAKFQVVGGSIRLDYNRKLEAVNTVNNIASLIYLDGSNYARIADFSNMNGFSVGTSSYAQISGNTTKVITFTASSSEIMRIDGSGKVGIGTSSPLARLDVKTGSAPFTALKISNYSSNANALYAGAVDDTSIFVGTGYYYNSNLYRTPSTVSAIARFDAGTFKVFTDSGLTANTDFTPSERLRITATGNVGIGTTAPNDIFYIGGSGGTATTTPGDDRTGHNYTNTYTGADPYSLVNVGYMNSTLSALPSVNSWLRGGNTVGVLSNIGTLDSYDFPIISSSTEVMRITKGGNVGIGKTNPGYMLDVANSISTDGSIRLSGASNSIYWNNVYTSIRGTGGALLFYSDISSSTERMRITTAGNVGIGTTNPSQKLEVSGNIVVSGSNYVSANSIIGTSGVQSPLFFNTSDANTVITTRTATKDIVFKLNQGTGTEIIRLTSGGNVGIGTTNPIVVFDARGSISSASGGVTPSGTAWFGANGSSMGLGIGNFNIAPAYSWIQSRDYSDATYYNLALNPNGGNVGIGTVLPNDIFYIGGSGGTATTTPGDDRTGHNYTDTYTGADPYSLVNVGYMNSAISAIPLGWSFDGNTLSQTELFGTLNAYDLPFITNGSERMRIKSGGKIGIGTADPGSALHVMSNQQSVAQFTSDYLAGNQSGYIGNGTYFSGVEFGLYYLSAGPDIPLAVYDTDSSLSLYGGGLSVDISGADTSGNVGIGTGTSTPTDKLDVKGPIYLQPSAPVATVNRLYNSGGNLFWNGTQLGAGSTAGDFWSLSGSNLYASSTSWNLIVGTTTTATSSKIWTDGSIHANSFVYGSLVASNVSAGSFGSNYGGGNYSFPGNLGIGTTSPAYKLSISTDGSYNKNQGIFFDNSIGIYRLASTQLGFGNGSNDVIIEAGGTLRTSSYYRVAPSNTAGGPTYTFNGDLDTGIFNPVANSLAFSASGTEVMRIIGDGSVGIGTTNSGAYKLKVAGDVAITGTLLTQTGSDFAEEFKAPSALEAGTVVVMGDAGYKSVKACENNYDKKVVGIVSDNASIIAGRTDIDKKNPEKVIVAMMGVVKVKVTALNGGINKGDLLTTSNLKGYAMKATKNKQGTIIGKALEDLNGEKGEVKVLVNLQ